MLLHRTPLGPNPRAEFFVIMSANTSPFINASLKI